LQLLDDGPEELRPRGGRSRRVAEGEERGVERLEPVGVERKELRAETREQEGRERVASLLNVAVVVVVVAGGGWGQVGKLVWAVDRWRVSMQGAPKEL
jgi:hypothetical protein